MTALCMSVTRAGRPQNASSLGGMLAVLAPHGTVGSTAYHADMDHMTVTAAAVWSDPDEARWADDAAAHHAPVRVFGEVAVFNRDALLDALGMATHSADLELVAAAYLRWGRDFPHHIHGDFAVAVVDIRAQAVMVVRDHVGHVPLVMHTSADRVAVATNALALTGLEGVGHDLDNDRVAEVLALAYNSSRTFVRGVQWLESGSALWIDAGGCTQWRWWDPDRDAVTDLGSLDAHAEALRAAFDEAVAGSLRTPGRLGATVSGGLDSTSVLATAAMAAGNQTITSWTSRPPAGWSGPERRGRDADEFDLVRDLAAMYPNIDARSFFVDGHRLFDHHRNMWELGSGPIRNPCNAQWAFGINEEAAACGVTLLLGGARGNIAFSADGPRWLLELARRGRVGALGREVGAWATAHGVSRRHVVKTDMLALVQPQWLRRWRGSPTIDDRVTEWLGATALVNEAWNALDLEDLNPTLVQADTTRWTRSLGEQFARGGTQSDTHTAAHALWGVSHRDPTVDRRVLAVAAVQPEWWRRHRGVDRAVVRRAMADRLPASIVHRSRRGDQLPDWFERLTEARQDMVAEVAAMRDHPGSRQHIDVERIDRLMASWPEPGSAQAQTSQAVIDYRLALTRAVHVSRYAQWFEDRARRVAAGGPVVDVDRDAGFAA
jgi:asparagine synthase (glutamine-hydrolysing)